VKISREVRIFVLPAEIAVAKFKRARHKRHQQLTNTIHLVRQALPTPNSEKEEEQEQEQEEEEEKEEEEESNDEREPPAL
jgi:ribosomal protein L12E/L44/L45/RPP1/RPP2